MFGVRGIIYNVGTQRSSVASLAREAAICTGNTYVNYY
jgi:hypothetical protein